MNRKEIRKRVLLLLLFLSLPSGCSLWRSIFPLGEKEKAKLDVHFNNGTVYYENEKFLQAEQQFRKALAIDPGYPGARLGLGLSLARQQRNSGKVREAQSILSSYVEDYPNDFEGFLGLGLYYLEGAILASKRRKQLEKSVEKDSHPARLDAEKEILEARKKEVTFLQEAIQNLKRVLELNRNNTRALAGLGEAYSLQKRYPEAIEAFSTFLQEAENSREWFKKIRNSSLDNTEVEIAEKKIKGNIRYEMEVRRTLANIFFKQREYAKAIGELDALLHLAETEKAGAKPEDYLTRGQCFFHNGEFQRATADLEAFLKSTDREFDDAVSKAYELLKRIKEQQE